MNKEEALKKIEDLKKFVEELDKVEEVPIAHGYITSYGSIETLKGGMKLDEDKYTIAYRLNGCDVYTDNDLGNEFLFFVKLPQWRD